MSGLTGKRILVTRASHQSASLCDALRARGAHPLEFPAIEIQSLLPSPDVDVALRALDRYDWVCFTSGNGARIAIRRWRDLQEGPWPSNVSVAAVGPATAGVLKGLGVPVHAVPDDFQGAALPAALGAISGRRVLLLRADIAGNELVEALRGMGAVVHDHAVYRTVPAAADARHTAAGREGADAVTFTSPSTVRGFLDLATRVSLPLDDLVVACIGPVTELALCEAGLAVHVRAEPHTVAGLVDALAAYWRANESHVRRSRAAAHEE